MPTWSNGATSVRSSSASCDGKGCASTFEGTRRQRIKAGWTQAWRRTKGVEIQIDLCHLCRTGVPRKKIA